MGTKNDITNYLNEMVRFFDELNVGIESITSMGKTSANQSNALQSIDMTEQKVIEELPKMFSAEQLALLLKVFFQLSEFNTKFAPILDERAKELENIRKLIKETSSNLHKILGEKIE